MERKGNCRHWVSPWVSWNCNSRGHSTHPQLSQTPRGMSICSPVFRLLTPLSPLGWPCPLWGRPIPYLRDLRRAWLRLSFPLAQPLVLEASLDTRPLGFSGCLSSAGYGRQLSGPLEGIRTERAIRKEKNRGVKIPAKQRVKKNTIILITIPQTCCCIASPLLHVLFPQSIPLISTQVEAKLPPHTHKQGAGPAAQLVLLKAQTGGTGAAPQSQEEAPEPCRCLHKPWGTHASRALQIFF